MFTNKTTLATYVSGIFFSDESKNADALVSEIIQNLELAEQMTARAKAAAFKCRSNRSSYERYLKEKETKRRRASIDKQAALRTNWCSARYIGEYAIGRVIKASEELVKILPVMMHDSKYDRPSSNDRLSRSSNCVLISRFLTGLSKYVTELRSGWAVEEKDKSDIGHASSDFSSLSHNVNERREGTELRYNDSLDIFFVRGVDMPGFAEVENRFDRLNAAMDTATQLLQAYAGAKSRYLNDEQFKARMAEASGPEASQQILDAYNAAMLDFEHVNWALTMISSRLFHVYDAGEKALVEADNALRSAKYNVILQNNMIALRTRMVVARALRRQVREIEDAQRHDARPYHARQQAFNAIPAVFHLPSIANF